MNESSQGQYQLNESLDKPKQMQDLTILIQDQNKFLSVFNQTNAKANNFSKSNKFGEAAQCFLKCSQMLEMGKDIFRKLSKYWPVCIYINLAFSYQNDWKLQKTNQYLEKSQQILLEMMAQISKQQKEQYLNMSLRLTKLKYQQCAVLSQLNQHEKALSLCQSTLPLLKQNIGIILEHAKKQYSVSQRQQTEYGVKFSVKVYSFAEQIFNNLLTKMQVSCDASKPSNIKKNSSMQFYYWEKNPQRNQKQLRNSFVPATHNQQTAKRSILGVTKGKTWIDDFNIGYLMKISQTSVLEWQKITPLEEYLFKQKMYEYVIYTSVGYFTMATQIRLIDSGKKLNEQDDKIKSKHQVIKRKYGYEQKTEQFALSESHHLTAISMVTENIQTLIPYLSHIIKSYDKHYIFKKNLDQIVAIAEQSVLQGSKISGIRFNQRTVSKTSILAHSVEQSTKKPFTKITQPQDQDYGYSYRSNSKSKISLNSSRSHSNQKQKINSKSQRKTLKAFDHTNNGMDHSLRHKTTLKSRTAQKLSQTLKLNTNKKIFTQESLNQLKNSFKREKKSAKSLTMVKHTSRKQKNKEILKPKDKQKQQVISPLQNKKIKTLKNNLKDKINIAAYEQDGQLHVKHKSSTSFKFVFKKKK